MPQLLKMLCLSVSLIGAPLASADPLPPAAVTVRSSDLDLYDDDGARTMLRRIERAAERVCGASTARQYPSTRRAYEACRRATIASTVSQLRAPLVSERHASRSASRPLAAAHR